MAIERRREKEYGFVVYYVTGLECQRCGRGLGERKFMAHEPQVGLCDRCGAEESRECRELGCVVRVDKPSEAKPIRRVAAEAGPGRSSGGDRKSMCYGNAENANGLWDNLVGELEDQA